MSDAGTQSTWQHLAGLKCTSVNPALLTDERLLRGKVLNGKQPGQLSHLPSGDISISNLDTCDQNVFLDDVNVEFPPDAKEQPFEMVGQPSENARGGRTLAPSV